MASESKTKHRPRHQGPGLLWRGGGLAVARHAWPGAGRCWLHPLHGSTHEEASIVYIRLELIPVIKASFIALSVLALKP